MSDLPQDLSGWRGLRRYNGAPVAALTLRYDRLDNFWFTLLHELAHIALHMDGNQTTISG